MVESKSKGHRLLHTCLSCHGLGMSTRIRPLLLENECVIRLCQESDLSIRARCE